jgi:hypothetical protein
MTDEITIGGLAASTLGIASEALLKGAAGEGVKDAYRALKDKIAKWGVRDVDALEREPASAARRAVVAEIIDAQPAEEAAAVRVLAKRLIAALRTGESAGLDVGRFEAAGLDVGRLEALEGRLSTSSQIDEIVTGSGNLIIHGVSIGVKPVEAWPLAGNK